MFTLRTERIIDAPAAIVWEVIADVEAYAAYAPNLSHAEKTSRGPRLPVAATIRRDAAGTKLAFCGKMGRDTATSSIPPTTRIPSCR
jgi:uncharacterized protein YndB with AHSA1/START domain